MLYLDGEYLCPLTEKSRRGIIGIQKKLELAAQVAGITEIDTLVTRNNTGITIIKKQLQQAKDD